MAWEEVEALIKEKGLKKSFVCQYIGCSKQNLYKVEHTKGRKLQMKRLLKLQELLGFDDELLKKLEED